MLYRAIRRLAAHRPTDANSVAGSFLARATDPYDILKILATNDVSSLIKTFALRRISLSLRRNTVPGFNTDPRYISLQSDIVSRFSAMTVPEALNTVFWLKVMKEINQPLGKHIRKQDIDALIARILTLAREETALGDRLIHLYFDFVKLGWDSKGLMPFLYRNMESGNQLYTWEDMKLLCSGVSISMNSRCEMLVRKMLQRMHGMGFNRGEFSVILSIAKSASEMSTAFNWDALAQLVSMCDETLCLKLERASIYSLSEVIEQYISYPTVLMPITRHCYPDYSRLMRDLATALPENFAFKVIVHCGQLKVRKYPVPKDLLKLAMKTALRYINSISLESYQELLSALFQLQSHIPLEFYTALVERSRIWPKSGAWTCALVNISSSLHCDFAHFYPSLSALVSKFDSLSPDQQLLSLACILSTPGYESSQFLQETGTAMTDMVLSRIQSNYQSYLRAVINQESKARFDPVQMLRPVVSALLKSLKTDQFIRLYQYFRFLTMTYCEFPEEVKTILEARIYQVTEIPIILRRLRYSTKIENVLKILNILKPVVTLGAIIPCLYIGKIRQRSTNADLFRVLMMQIQKRWVSDEAFYHHIEEIAGLIGNESEVWQEFLNRAHQELEESSIPAFKLMKILDAFNFPLTDFYPEDEISLRKLSHDSEIQNPEIIVKLAKGKITNFDADLVSFSMENTKYEIRDKIIAVTMRNDSDLMGKFVVNLKLHLKTLAWNYVASILELLTDYPTEAYFEGKNALFAHLLERLNLEIVSIPSALTFLSAMGDLRSFSDPAFHSLFAYLKSTQWQQTTEEKAQFLRCLCKLGYKDDPELLEKLISELGNTDSELRTCGHEVVNALNCGNLLKLDSAGRFCRKYLDFLFRSGRIPKHDVKEVLVPLIRANITTSDEFQRLFSMSKPGLSLLSPIQKCLLRIHLITQGYNSESEYQPQVASNPFSESLPQTLLKSLDSKGVNYVLMHYIGSFPVPLYFPALRKGVFVVGSRSFSLCGKEPSGDVQFFKELGEKILPGFDVVGSEKICADPEGWVESVFSRK